MQCGQRRQPVVRCPTIGVHRSPTRAEANRRPSLWRTSHLCRRRCRRLDSQRRHETNQTRDRLVSAQSPRTQSRRSSSGKSNINWKSKSAGSSSCRRPKSDEPPEIRHSCPSPLRRRVVKSSRRLHLRQAVPQWRLQVKRSVQAARRNARPALQLPMAGQDLQLPMVFAPMACLSMEPFDRSVRPPHLALLPLADRHILGRRKTLR
mmetsp:Transcript_39242/g.108085  ORF Transcript_39242/g.108085 Transcript_39242/m.108085 type:complete len:206 (+) Transcript_39242:632-1249(+)